MTNLIDVVRSLTGPVLRTRRASSIALRHRGTGRLLQLAGDDDLLAFPDEAEAMRFISVHACEPEAWEAIPLAS